MTMVKKKDSLFSNFEQYFKNFRLSPIGSIPTLENYIYTNQKGPPFFWILIDNQGCLVTNQLIPIEDRVSFLEELMKSKLFRLLRWTAKEFSIRILIDQPYIRCTVTMGSNLQSRVFEKAVRIRKRNTYKKKRNAIL
jgi:hypothetical protein